MIDLPAWYNVVIDAVDAVADEDFQRRAWSGQGPEESSPDETVNQLLGDAAFEAFLARADNGLTAVQLEAGEKLLTAMTLFVVSTPATLYAGIIDDPMWRDVRAAAVSFSRHVKGCQ